MKIIIVGAGKVGELLCEDLASEGSDVILIEQNEKKLEQLIERSDITGLHGNGAEYEVLIDAGVQEAGVFIAVTDDDEINIVSSIIAKKLGAKNTIARVRNPRYATHIDFMRESLGIDMMVNPEKLTAKTIINTLRYREAMDVETFVDNKVSIIKLELTADNELVGKSLIDFQKMVLNHILVCIVERGEEVYIPSGDFVLKAGDLIHVTGTSKDLERFCRDKGFHQKPIRSCFIVGGGKVSYYLVEILLQHHIDVKIVEVDEKKAEALSADFPEAEVIYGDGTNQDFLDRERVADYDVFISLTGIDEENIIASLYAKAEGVSKTVTKVDRTRLLSILTPGALKSIVSPKKIVADIIVRYVRALINSTGSKVETLHRMADNRVEALEFIAKSDSRLIDTPIRQLQLKDGILIAFIIRNHKALFPSGDDVILPRDRVVVVTTNRFMDDLDGVLEGRR